MSTVSFVMRLGRVGYGRGGATSGDAARMSAYATNPRRIVFIAIGGSAWRRPTKQGGPLVCGYLWRSADHVVSPYSPIFTTPEILSPSTVL